MVVAAIFVPGSLLAQDIGADMDALIENVDEDTVSYDKSPVPAPTVDAVNLDVHWRLWKRVSADGNLGLEELDALTHDAVSLGHRNLPDYSSAVYTTTAAKVASGEISERDASKLYDQSRTLAPDLPYPELAHSAHLVRHNTGRLPAIVGSYIQGIKKGFRWLDTRLAWELKLSAYALLAFLVAVLFFLFAQLLRYFGIVTYDCARLLPRGFSSNQTVILIVALVVVPGLLMRSPLVSMLVLLAAMSTVQRINERVVTLVIFAVLAALPYIDARMSEQTTWPASDTQSLMHAQYLHCDTDCTSELERRWHEGESDDRVLTYTLALARYRQGGESNMENVRELLGSHESWPSDIEPSVETLLGATRIAQAEPDKAIEHLERAKQLDPQSPVPPFNLMRAYQMNDDGDAASTALDEAISVNLESVRMHLEMTRRDVNSFLLVEPLDSDVFMRRHLAQDTEHVSLVSPVWKAMAGPEVPLDWAPFLGGIGLLIALLSLPVQLGGRSSSPCPKCGMARDPEDGPQTGHHRYCLPCYHTFVSGASLDYNARVHNERVLGRRERFQDVMRRVLSVILPGTGHSQAGHGLAGFILSFVMVFAALIIWRPMGVWRPTYELFSDNWAAQISVAWVLVSIGGFFVLQAALRGISPTEISSSSRSRRSTDV